jgi:hypothetical protein
MRLLESLVDGAAYRFFFSNRGAWNGTAHRTDDGAVSILWHGETPAQDRRFALAAESDGIVVVGKQTWGHLIDAKRRSDGAPVTRATRQARSSRPGAYQPHPERDRRRTSAVALAEFAASSGDLDADHRRKTLSLALWLATEADGKYNLRYRSAGARELGPADRRLLRHEHVQTRKQLIDEITAHPSRTREIVLSALACVVTDDEHQRLTAVAENLQGWNRYIAAGVDVYDEQAGKPIIANGEFSDSYP